jgi:hypothetical protein
VVLRRVLIFVGCLDEFAFQYVYELAFVLAVRKGAPEVFLENDLRRNVLTPVSFIQGALFTKYTSF